MSQRALQQTISNLGGNVAHNQISRYERGLDRPAAENLMWFLAGCGADLAQLQAALSGGYSTSGAARSAEIRRGLGELRKLHEEGGQILARLAESVEE